MVDLDKSGVSPLGDEGASRSSKKKPNLPTWWKYAAIALVALVILTIAIIAFTNGDAEPTDTSSAPKDNPAVSGDSDLQPDEKPVPAEGGWSAVTLTDGTALFGDVVEGDIPGHIVLLNAYYITKVAEDGQASTLKRFGSEMYMPTPAVVLPLTAIMYREPLAASSGALVAIQANEEEAPPKVKVPKFDKDTVGAVFLANGEVFFGYIVFDGDFLVVKDVHFLKYKDDSAAEARAIESLDQVELVPRSTGGAQTSGEMRVPTSSVLYLQEVTEDSPVARAMKGEQ